MMMATEVETVEAPVRSLASIGYGEDSWGGGVFGVVENPSPFPRINGLRNRFQDDRPLTIDSERAAPATEACRKHEGKPQQIKVAAVLGHILKNVSLQIAEGQLLAGDSAAPPKSCPIHRSSRMAGSSTSCWASPTTGREGRSPMASHRCATSPVRMTTRASPRSSTPLPGSISGF
jgi:hypothetical protein